MKTWIFLISIFIYLSNSFSQIPEIVWESNFGGSDWDQGNCILQTIDGGFIVSGYTYSDDLDVQSNNGVADFWVTKISSLGILEWSKNYGGSGTDLCYKIANCGDGYILAGGTNSTDIDITINHGNFDYWLVKIDLDGNMLWQNCYGGSEYDMAHDVYITEDGGIIITGESKSSDGNITGHHGGTNSDFWVLKTDSIGTIEWEKSLGTEDNGHGTAIIQTNDEGYIAIGPQIAPGRLEDFLIYKLNSAGDILWEANYGGTDSDIPIDIIELSSQKIQLCGLTFSNDGDVDGFHGGCDTWILEIDSVGELVWNKALGGDNFEAGYTLIEANNEGTIIAGIAESNNGDLAENYGYEDFWLLKIDTEGNLVWQRNFGGSDYDEIFSLTSLEDSSLIVSGHTRSNDIDVEFNNGNFDYWIVKIKVCEKIYFLDSDGDGYGDSEQDTISCDMPFGYITDSTDCNDLNPDIYPGAPELLNGLDDDCDGQSDEGLSIINNKVFQLFIHPIPATDHIIIDYNTSTPTTLNIYTSSGAIIYHNALWTGEAIDISNFPPAMYYLQLLQPEKVGYGCFVKE